MSQQIVQVGAGIRISINGKIVGYATGLSYTRNLNTKTVFELDNPFAAEIFPTTYLVQGTLTGIRLRSSGGLDGSGYMDVSTPAKFFTQQYCTLEVIDILTSASIITMQKVVFDADSFQIQNKNVVTFSANFKAVFLANETSQGI